MLFCPNHPYSSQLIHFDAFSALRFLYLWFSDSAGGCSWKWPRGHFCLVCHLFCGGGEEGPDSCVLSSASPSSMLVSVRLLLLVLVHPEVAASSSFCPLAAAVSVAQSVPCAVWHKSSCFRAAAGFVVARRDDLLLSGRKSGWKDEWNSGHLTGREKSWFWGLRLDACKQPVLVEPGRDSYCSSVFGVLICNVLIEAKESRSLNLSLPHHRMVCWLRSPMVFSLCMLCMQTLPFPLWCFNTKWNCCTRRDWEAPWPGITQAFLAVRYQPQANALFHWRFLLEVRFCVVCNL